VFFYERRLRATEAFSCINDDLLRVRARSRSRSKSLTRVASNMSLGKIFSRSRSSSPSRRYSIEEHHDQDSETTSHVPDPIFKVATVNKQLENEFRGQSTDGVYSNESYSIATPAVEGSKTRGQHHSPPYPTRINTNTTTQPHYYNNTPPSEIFVRNDTHFIDSFNQSKQNNQQPQEDILYGGSNAYQDNSSTRPHPYSRRRSSVQSYNNFDAMLFSQSPHEMLTRPSSGGSSASSSSNETSPISATGGGTTTTTTTTAAATTDTRYGVPPFSSDTNSTTTSSSNSGYPYNSMSSYSSSIRSYLEEGNLLANHQHERYGSIRSNHSFSSDERLMNAIDGSRRSSAASTASASTAVNHRGKKHAPPPLPKAFYSQSQIPITHYHQQQQNQRQQPPNLPHRAYTTPSDSTSTNFAKLKLDVNDLIDDLIQSQQSKAKDMDRYNTYESVRGLRTVSEIFFIIMKQKKKLIVIFY
jgi:hypothetical protein